MCKWCINVQEPTAVARSSDDSTHFSHLWMICSSSLLRGQQLSRWASSCEKWSGSKASQQEVVVYSDTESDTCVPTGSSWLVSYYLMNNTGTVANQMLAWNEQSELGHLTYTERYFLSSTVVFPAYAVESSCEITDAKLFWAVPSYCTPRERKKATTALPHWGSEQQTQMLLIKPCL